MIHCGPRLDHHTSTMDAADAFERGTVVHGDRDLPDLHPDDVLPSPIPLDATWQAALDASIADVKARRSKAAGAA